jgi:hypothetical protein
MEKVSFKKVIRNDGYIVSAIVTFVIFCILLVVFLAMPENSSDLGIYLILGFNVLSLSVLLIRLLLIMNFKTDNKIYKAKVIKVFTYRSTKHITFTYMVDGAEYSKRNALLSSKFSRNIFKEDEVEVFVSLTNPAKALIKEAYFETEVL